MFREKAKSILQTRTFQGASIALLGGIAPIAIACGYQKRLPTQNEAIAAAALVSAFSSAMVGRVETSPVYTPDGFPGPSKKDFDLKAEGSVNTSEEVE
jgi:hypothetical protein